MRRGRNTAGASESYLKARTLPIPMAWAELYKLCSRKQPRGRDDEGGRAWEVTGRRGSGRCLWLWQWSRTRCDEGLQSARRSLARRRGCDRGTDRGRAKTCCAVAWRVHCRAMCCRRLARHRVYYYIIIIVYCNCAALTVFLTAANLKLAKYKNGLGENPRWGKEV